MKYWWVIIGVIGTILTILLILDQGWNIWTQILLWSAIISFVAIISRVPCWRLQEEILKLTEKYNYDKENDTKTIDLANRERSLWYQEKEKLMHEIRELKNDKTGLSKDSL